MVAIGVGVILAIPVKKRKMPKPVNSLLKNALGHFPKDYWLVGGYEYCDPICFTCILT